MVQTLTFSIGSNFDFLDPGQNKTGSKACLGMYWALSTQSMPMKPVDLGYWWVCAKKKPVALGHTEESVPIFYISLNIYTYLQFFFFNILPSTISALKPTKTW